MKSRFGAEALQNFQQKWSKSFLWFGVGTDLVEVFIKNQKYDMGKNILLNRFCDPNDLIDKKWIKLSLETFKIKCKEQRLINWLDIHVIY